MKAEKIKARTAFFEVHVLGLGRLRFKTQNGQHHRDGPKSLWVLRSCLFPHPALA